MRCLSRPCRIAAPATTPTPAPTDSAAEPNVKDEAESSSTSGEDGGDGGGGGPKGAAPEKVAASTSSVSSDSSGERRGYLVGIAELEERVAALQKEKTELEASLASVRIRVETSCN